VCDRLAVTRLLKDEARWAGPVGANVVWGLRNNVAVLYVVEQGAVLRKTGDRFLIEKDDSVVASVPALKIEQVVIFGNVQLTTPAIVYMLKNGIDTVFLSVSGSYYGRLLSSASKLGELRQRHLRLVDDAAKALEVAQTIVAAKLHNSRTLLQRTQRDHPHPDLTAAIETLGALEERAGRTTRISSLVGVEGQGSAVYFGGFRHVLLHDLGFRGRVRRPPTDPVNVLLSFGYTLLTYGIQSAVETVGLDPYVGFLHAPGYSRPALVLDLMEEFRAVIVDSVVFRLINARIVTEDDFELTPDDPERPIVLKDGGRRRFLTAYEERVQMKVTDRRSGEQVTMRRLWELQARQIARLAMGEQAMYEPWRIR